MSHIKEVSFLIASDAMERLGEDMHYSIPWREIMAETESILSEMVAKEMTTRERRAKYDL